MSPEPFLPLIVILALEGGDAPSCAIEAVQDGGMYTVTADVRQVETGLLSYWIDTTVVTGSNRSRSVNGGSVSLTKGGDAITIWTGRIGGNDTSRVSIRLEGEINARSIVCEARLP